MNELIRITTDKQGSFVVSARELYTFLQFDASQWARWSKKNITGNPFAQAGRDFHPLDIMSNGSTDYALTLDFAKRMSMLARTERGEQIRRYFVDCERQLTGPVIAGAAPAPPSATEAATLQLLTQQTQLMAGVSALVERLQTEVQQLKAGYRPPQPRQLPQPIADLPPRQLLRGAIERQVSEYSTWCGSDRSDAYIYLYKRLYDVNGISVHRLIAQSGEQMLDTIERYGYLDRLYVLAINELAYPNGR